MAKTPTSESSETVQRVLARNFLGPDGKLYARANSAGDVLVHTFPADWTLPKGAKSPRDLMQKDSAELPEPTTFAEMTKRGMGGEV